MVSTQAAYWVLVLVTVIYWSLVVVIVSSLFTGSNIDGCKIYSLRKTASLPIIVYKNRERLAHSFSNTYFNIISHRYSDLPTLSANYIFLTSIYTHVKRFPHDFLSPAQDIILNHEYFVIFRNRTVFKVMCVSPRAP